MRCLSGSQWSCRRATADGNTESLSTNRVLWTRWILWRFDAKLVRLSTLHIHVYFTLHDWLKNRLMGVAIYTEVAELFIEIWVKVLAVDARLSTSGHVRESRGWRCPHQIRSDPCLRCPVVVSSDVTNTTRTDKLWGVPVWLAMGRFGSRLPDFSVFRRMPYGTYLSPRAASKCAGSFWPGGRMFWG